MALTSEVLHNHTTTATTTTAMVEQESEFLKYPSIIDDDDDDDDKLSTNSTVYISNRTSYCSVNNEIDDDDSVSTAMSVIEEKLYVALGKDLKEGERILLWALKNSGGRTICILHVHQPDQMIPFMGAKFPANKLKEKSVREHREVEIQKMHNVLNEYLLICKRFGVQAEKLHIETDCIEKGIVKIISQYGMKRLVMGAAAAKHYFRKMTVLKSKKAIYVNAEAPVTCHICFVWKGHLIYTREGIGFPNEKTMPEVQQPSPKPEVEKTDPVIVRSVTVGPGAQQNHISPKPEVEKTDPVIVRSVTVGPGAQQNHISPSQNYDRAMPVNLHGRTVAEIYPVGDRGVSTSNSACHSEASSDDWEGISQSSQLSTCSSSDGVGRLALTFYVSAEGTQGTQDENDMQLLALPLPQDDVTQASPPRALEERVDFKLYNQLEQAMTEARYSSRDASEERVRRGIAEQEAVDAILRARASESIYADELKQRKEVEAKLLKERLERENIQNQRDEVRHELQYAREQQSQLESRLAESDVMVRDLEERIISAVGLLKNYKKQRDDLQRERDNALKLAEDLRRKQAKFSSTDLSQFFSEFSFFEIEEATRSFHPSLKIGEGGYGTIYKGLLRHTEVAIKMLHSHSLQGPSEYRQEVDILSKLRHPNLVTLIGACPDAWTLIYEYLPNGSLEDRLNCKDNSPPLSWQTRIRVAAELCSVLVFLHSSKPHSIVHGDLNPSNILLDANFVSKLSDFGICRVILPDNHASIEATACYRTDPQGTFAYMDPELFSSGELTTKSDVYSFGIVLLRLLTGKAAVGIIKEVQNALDYGNLKSLLDCSAGDWPYVQAHQLAHLALRCVEINRKNRPDLGSEVWRVLEAMRASCGGSSSSLRIGSEDRCQAPHYFICPIFQEVMQDPHVAADGFTYEAESLKGWLDSGHDTSPMTNLKLANKNLVPNLALRSAIQEWLQKQKQ